MLRIIDPIASRCSKFRFKPLDNAATAARLQYIAAQESIPVEPSVIQTLIDVSEGDLRRSITYLQSASRLSASANPPIPITTEDIQEIAGSVPESTVRRFAGSLGVECDGDGDGDKITRARGFDDIRKAVRELMTEGYSAAQLLLQVRLSVFFFGS